MKLCLYGSILRMAARWQKSSLGTDSLLKSTSLNAFYKNEEKIILPVQYRRKTNAITRFRVTTPIIDKRATEMIQKHFLT